MLRMPVLLYTASWCRDCREAKRFLDKHNIPYTEIDIETTPGAAEEVLQHVGKRAIPQFVIEGRWVQPYRPGRGFLYEEMAKRLGVSEQQVVLWLQQYEQSFAWLPGTRSFVVPGAGHVVMGGAIDDRTKEALSVWLTEMVTDDPDWASTPPPLPSAAAPTSSPSASPGSSSRLP